MGDSNARDLEHGVLHNHALHFLACHGCDPTSAGADRASLSGEIDKYAAVVCLLVVCWTAHRTVALLHLSVGDSQHWPDSEDQNCAGRILRTESVRSADRERYGGVTRRVLRNIAANILG